MMAPLLCLGLPAVTQGSVPGLLLKYVIPQHMSTQMLNSASVMDSLGFFIKMPVNGQEPCLGRCAQHFK